MYLIILYLPLISCLISGFFGRFLTTKGVGFFSTSCIFFSVLVSIFCFFEVALSRSFCYVKLLSWIDCAFFDGCWGFIFDSLSIGMCCVVTLISYLVHLYSTVYMSHDPHQSRFMCYLSLFTFFMLMLVTADNFLQLFFGWEGVGLCSFLLINFWFTRLQANKSAIKAMVVNRIGDIGLALAIFFLFNTFKSIDFAVLFCLIPHFCESEVYFLTIKGSVVFFSSILLFLAAMGKSAQLGLHTWLPDAMEGPTPVSALIHAATMVTAGVFLIIRCSPIFEYSPEVLFIIVIIGTLTCFFAGTVGLVQNDAKKIIAYSTCSQLGYMFFACGLSNYSVGFFHLFNHAFFKALLFLSAGSIIHALNNEQDLRKMGGLLKVLPLTYSVFVVGSFALMGMPFLAGFYSKDIILETAFVKYSLTGSFAFWVGCIAASFTSFYSIRLLFLVFLTKPNGFKQSYQHAHEPVFGMLFPLILLAILSIFIGFITKDLFIGFGTPFWLNAIYNLPKNIVTLDLEFIPTVYKLLPLLFSLFGAFSSFFLYQRLSTFFSNFVYSIIFVKIYTFLNKKWFFDKLQNEILTSMLLKCGFKITYKQIDKGLIEFLGPLGLSMFFISLAKRIIKLQSGFIHQYAIIFFSGIIFLLIKITITFSFLLFPDLNLFVFLILGLIFF
uniref:NADH-ubiquinone oxidoreductase chain 5 n=1 Tax=Storeatula sp. CCMP1868 TaxID=195070 RepID=A0A2P1G865_9CRYP|nr:NADH dehydrogenase subunit 5 [Storeatula sp. CCMP1868]AVM81142.1 NADH dehydrogenase subunit 5 [Storeatula sp. CCMP1868]